MFLLKMSENLHILFAAKTHLPAQLYLTHCSCRSRKFSYFPCGHTNINGVHDRMAINFVLQTLITTTATAIIIIITTTTTVIIKRSE
jgi:hypothetical protein